MFLAICLGMDNANKTEAKASGMVLHLCGERLPVWSLDGAVALVSDARDVGGIGSSDFYSFARAGEIRMGRTLVARVSYNGRLWHPDGRAWAL